MPLEIHKKYISEVVTNQYWKFIQLYQDNTSITSNKMTPIPKIDKEAGRQTHRFITMFYFSNFTIDSNFKLLYI